MNAKQQKTIDYIKQRVMRDDVVTDRREMKRFEIEEHERFISVVTEVGLKNDEGTIAQLHRRRRHLFVGVRGGISAYNKNSVRVKGRKAWHV